MTGRCWTPKKTRYTSWSAANQVAKNIKRTSGDSLRPYHCACGGYHLTSEPA